MDLGGLIIKETCKHKSEYPRNSHIRVSHGNSHVVYCVKLVFAQYFLPNLASSIDPLARNFFDFIL